MIRRFLRNRAGTAAIEFGLTTPFVVLGIVGILTMSVYYFKRDQVDDAVRLAVRDVIVQQHETPDTIKQAFTARLTRNGFGDVVPKVEILDGTEGRVAHVDLVWTENIVLPFVDIDVIDYNVNLDIPI